MTVAKPICLLALAVWMIGAQQSRLTNQDIIEMLKTRFEEETILRAIHTQEGAWDTSPEALIALKGARASDRIVAAIVEASAKPGSGILARVRGQLPRSNGVFLVTNNSGEHVMRELDPEIVSWRDWVRKPDLGISEALTGVVKNRRSELRVTGPPIEFVIRCAPTTTAVEYQLLRLWTRPDRREFRTARGGALRVGAIPFDAEKLAPHTYAVRIPGLQSGEYGFIPAGGRLASNAASLGTIYTFGVD